MINSPSYLECKCCNPSLDPERGPTKCFGYKKGDNGNICEHYIGIHSHGCNNQDVLGALINDFGADLNQVILEPYQIE